MVRTNQGGSVLSFVIVGIILAALAVGGVFGIRQMMNQSQPSKSQPIVTQPETKQSTTQSDPDQEAEKKKAEEKAQQQAAEQKAADEKAANDAAQSAQTTPTTAAPSTAALPHTGPIEDFGTIIALGLLSIAVVSYVRSRRLELPL